MVGSAANDSLDTIFPKIDAELAKHFEDRNVLLTDGGIITFTGTQLQFTENLNIVLNQKISGATPQVISLGSSNVNFSATGRMWYAVIDRTAGTATQTTDATTLPAATSANQEVFLIAKRIDAGDGTQRVYWRNGTAMSAGQSIRLGASGSGSGSGSGDADDFISQLFRATFSDKFDEGTTDSKSAVDATAGKTDPTAYSAAKALYQLNYDASKTVAGGTTTTNLNISANAAFTVKIGDIAIYGSEARRITAVANQASFTVDAFSTAPTVSGQVTISQAVYSKDIYNFAGDGSALSAAFSGATFSEVMVDYEDTSTVGDNIFDINTAPVIAYDASANGSTFTSVKIRPTLATDQVQSIFLPAAGTSLYLRFYAYKTSGSGSVNVLRYKAGMQKQVQTGTGGGYINSALAFTNNVGTPVNCSIGSLGGKTTVILSTWQYPMGINTGTADGALTVTLNGQEIPRYIDATLTPDGSYVEISPTIIQLDKDYSTINLSVKVTLRSPIVDYSSTNSSDIFAIQEASSQGFQGFISTSSRLLPTTSAGAPASGLFYSTIANRASIPNIAQDLKPSLGIDRFVNQNIYLSPTEYGPNGEPVWIGTQDDRGLIRYVGSGWTNNNDTSGTAPHTAVTNDYVEITFYGTALNMVVGIYSAAADLRASTDGGSEGSNLWTGGTAYSNLMTGRYYNQNQVLPVVSGLTLGVHTVKIRYNAAVAVRLYGFEALNTSSTTSLTINPGTAYVNSKKLVSASSILSAFSSAFTNSYGTAGSRGGHVLVYQAADGTIKKDIQYTNTAQANLTSADHTNEEVARVYHVREFAGGHSTDFSTNASSASRYFTLEDDSTALYLNNGYLGLSAFENVWTDAGTISFTFVGTGLDVYEPVPDATSRAYTVSINGSASVGTITHGVSGPAQTRKIVSGLPYGTHTVRFTPSGGAGIMFSRFIVYQPKKPALPAGAVELADYNLMATYVANATAGVGFIGTGLLRKSSKRELVYQDGTGGALSWSFAGFDPLFISAYDVPTDRNAASYSYTFFGTGVELRGLANTDRKNGNNVTLNGLAATTANFPSLVSSQYGGWTFSAGVLGLNAATQAGAGVSISGLPLGLYTLKVTTTNGTAASYLTIDTIDVITPIHAHKSVASFDLQNSLPIGSAALSDNRKFSALKDVSAQTKNISQAIGYSTATTTSTQLIPLPSMTTIHTNRTGRVKVSYAMQFGNNQAAGYTITQAFMDGLAVTLYRGPQNGANFGTINCDSIVLNVAPGTHKFDVYWAAGVGTSSYGQGSGVLTVEEV